VRARRAAWAAGEDEFMSLDPLSPPTNDPPARDKGAWAVWIVVGAAGVGLFFAASVHLPESARLPGLLFVVLGSAAGWALGRWATAMKIRPTALVAVTAGLLILAGEVLAAAKMHREGVRIMRSQKQWQQFPDDPVSLGVKKYLSEEPENESDAEREQRRQTRDAFERTENLRRERLEYLTFYGYLTHRIPKQWGKWSSPWPAVFWGVEVLAGSALGGWLALVTLRAAACQKE